MPDPKFKIVELDSSLAAKFKEINEEWISKMFVLEPKDEKVLGSPETTIIASGGCILFVAHPDLGIVGTCALLRTGRDEYELTKMGVLEKARGTGAGQFLLREVIKKAKSIGAKRLYLLTNKICESAIHLYEKNGFNHDKEIMDEYGSEYARCDVAMSHGDFQKDARS
jgi:N-acetylglutamate synthase-like GNAT family acetyltransferase